MGFSQEALAKSYDISSGPVADNKKWMADYPDNFLVTELSIPGTHDSAATKVVETNVFAWTQSMEITDQLESGIRYLDLRAKCIPNDTVGKDKQNNTIATDCDFPLHHGDIYLEANLDDALNDVRDFLKAHPSEFVIVGIDQSDQSEFNIKRAMDKYLAPYDDFILKRKCPGNFDIPLGKVNDADDCNARGKMLIISFLWRSEEVSDYAILAQGDIPAVFKQNNYDMGDITNLDTKWDYVKDHLIKAAGGRLTQIYLNFLSATGHTGPYFWAGGDGDPYTETPLATGKTTPGWGPTEVHPFPRKDCIGADDAETCTIYYEGINILTNLCLRGERIPDDTKYRHQPRYLCDNRSDFEGRLGIMAMDFPGKDVIEAIINTNNLAPTPGFVGPSIIEKRTNEFLFSATDDDPLTSSSKIEVDWGDGTKSMSEQSYLVLFAGQVKFSHTYDTVGEHEIEVRVTDSRGATGIGFFTITLPDTDGDGIQDRVDTLPNEFSDDADDKPNFGGNTNATIIERGDQDVSIIEESSPDDGLFIGAFTTDAGAGAVGISEGQDIQIQVIEPDPENPAEISVCGSSALLRIVSGDSAIVTCGSVTIEGISGTVDADFQVRCRTHMTTLTPGQILTFDPKTWKYTNSGNSDIIIKNPGFITLAVGETKRIGSSCGDADHEPPTIGKNLAGTKQMVENGFCIDADCFTVTKLFHEEFKLYEMMTGTHTLSTLIYCSQGVQHCRYSAIGIMPYDKDMRDTVWKVEMIGDHLGQWNLVVDDPEELLGEVTATAQLISDRFLGVSFTMEFKNKETSPMKVGVQVRDEKRGVRNFYFNEGVKFLDSDAYPGVAGFYEEPLKPQPLCIDRDINDRNSCAFDMVRDWSTEQAQKMLQDMQNGNYIYDDYYRKHFGT